MRVFTGKSLCVITGASRGIGREIAIQAAQMMDTGSAMVLLARDEGKLEEVADLVRKKSKNSVEVWVWPVDLAKPLDPIWPDLANACQLDNPRFGYTSFVLFHNAGSIGDVSKSADKIDDFEEMTSYWNLNLTGFIALTSKFLGSVKSLFQNSTSAGSVKSLSQKATLPNITIVNITSLFGIKGFPGCALYSAGKAAREGFLRVLTAENPDIRVLNWSPGPVETDMAVELAANIHDAKMKAVCADRSKRLTTEMTIGKMFEVLEQGGFASGDHVDYFDV